MTREEYEAARCDLLSRLTFGWILDATHGNEQPVWGLSGDEFVRRSLALAEEYEAEESA